MFFPRQFSALAIASVFIAILGCSSKKDPAARPNLILISIDTLRADHLGCYGYPRPTSPAIDQLASEGVVFKNVMATSPWTLPSHGSMLTGMYPSRMSLNSYESKLPSTATTLSMLLAKNGFKTAAVVNSIFLRQKHGFDRGFDYFVATPGINDSAPSIIKLSKLWMRHQGQQPFFLFIHIFDAHSSYFPHKKYKEKFVRPYKGPVNGSTSFLHKIRNGEYEPQKEDVDHIIDLYDAEVRQVDDNLKDLFDYLRTSGVLDSSVVIISSDHGEEFLEHGGVFHGKTQYQELLKIPLIIRGPGIPSGRRISAVSSLVDVMPTALSLLGLPVPAALEGTSLVPMWKTGESGLTERSVFAEADHNNEQDNIKRAVRYQNYKLHYDLLTKKIELYDLAVDPFEQTDIAENHPQIVDRLFKKLTIFMQPPQKSKQIVPLSNGELEKLKSLGYM
jgi:arylsulfatase A-like enzyme